MRRTLQGVHVLFIGASERPHAEALVKLARGAGVLTVADWEGALHAGTVLQFVKSEGRLRFEASLEGAERSGLRISSRLLAVASRVYSVRP